MVLRNRAIETTRSAWSLPLLIVTKYIYGPDFVFSMLPLDLYTFSSFSCISTASLFTPGGAASVSFPVESAIHERS